jgi:hypothetical protein
MTQGTVEDVLGAAEGDYTVRAKGWQRCPDDLNCTANNLARHMQQLRPLSDELTATAKAGLDPPSNTGRTPGEVRDRKAHPVIAHCGLWRSDCGDVVIYFENGRVYAKEYWTRVSPWRSALNRTMAGLSKLVGW